MSLKEGVLFFKSEIKINIILISISILSGFVPLIVDKLTNPSMPEMSLALSVIVWFIFGMMILVRNFVR